MLRTMPPAIDVAGTSVPLSVTMADVVREYRVGGQVVRAVDGIDVTIGGGAFVAVVANFGNA